MQIFNGEFQRDESSVNSKGGTEYLAEKIVEYVPQEILKEFQIIVSRQTDELDPSKIRLYWCHDLADDPSTEHLANGGWKKFHRIIFVSNWQMQTYIGKYDIPWEHCIVLPNAIEPIEEHTKPTGTLRLAYWSTPHRGLNILVPVFKKLAEDFDVELDVYSSFELYGWKKRDELFEALFEECRDHPRINYHGAVANDQIREALKTTHILAYPNTWQETSCLVLMEAMSAGLVCVHSNYAALFETSANWTHIYQYHEDVSNHAAIFYQALRPVIENYNSPIIQNPLGTQKMYADYFYTWDARKVQWTELLTSLLPLPRELPVNEEEKYFVFNT